MMSLRFNTSLCCIVPRCRRDDNIKLDLREIGIDGANCIRLAQDRVQWRSFVNIVMKFRVP